jgi:hypothetical protein
MNKKKRKNKLGASLQMKYIVTAILLVLVILVAIYILIYIGKTNGNWKDILPDWIIGNTTRYYGERGCPAGTKEIGFIGKDSYIILNSERTVFYVQESKVIADISYKNSVVAYFSQAFEVKFSDNGYGLIGGYGLYSLPQYRDKFPPKNDIILFSKSYLSGSSFCVKNEEITNVEKKKDCKLTCELINGVCSDSASEERVYAGIFECTDNKKCYVKSFEKILDSTNLRIKDSYLVFYPDSSTNNEPTTMNLIDKDDLIVSVASKLALFVNVNHKIDGFCYSFDTDKTTRVQDYKGFNYPDNIKPVLNTEGMNYKFNSGTGSGSDMSMWVYSDEKYIQFIAWESDTKEKILLRLKLESRGVKAQFGDDGKIIRDSDFYTELSKASDDSIFYIILTDKYSFKTTVTNKLVYFTVFKIIKRNEDDIAVYGYNENKKKFEYLDCGSGPLREALRLDEAVSSFTKTLDKVRCFYGFF